VNEKNAGRRTLIELGTRQTGRGGKLEVKVRRKGIDKVKNKE
jgi:hypothetical protein